MSAFITSPSFYFSIQHIIEEGHIHGGISAKYGNIVFRAECGMCKMTVVLQVVGAHKQVPGWPHHDLFRPYAVFSEAVYRSAISCDATTFRRRRGIPLRSKRTYRYKYSDGLIRTNRRSDSDWAR